MWNTNKIWRMRTFGFHRRLIKPYPKKYLCLVLLFSNLLLFSQAPGNIALPDESQIKIELYRGCVEVFSSQNNNFAMEEVVYDYDAYVNNKNKVEIPGPAIKVEKNKETLGLKSSSRNLLYLKIYVPASVELDINISHYGEVILHNVKNIINIQLYEGSIVGSLSNTSSANIEREGDIRLNFKNLLKSDS